MNVVHVTKGSSVANPVALDAIQLRRENVAFDGTYGISRNNGCLGFIPAFCDTETGRVEVARFANGRPAPMHLLEGLPQEWAVGRGIDGRICAVKHTVIAGFLRGGLFYTREQAAKAR